MASTIQVTVSPEKVQSFAYAVFAAGEPFLSQTGKLFFKIDANTCLNVEQSSIDIAPTSGYRCDVKVFARYM